VSTAKTSLDFSKLRHDLVKVVARICPSWLAAGREDVVQAALMRVMQIVEKKAGGEENAPLASSYLYKVGYSVLVDEIRRVRRRNETVLDDEPAVPAVQSLTDPERLTASREIGRGILDCLARLARDRRLAVTMYLQGHSVPDAARVLAWSPKRTENLVYRGLADLRACLESKGMRP
jgi:RNA polymerase sigma-70 factor (ECF subfamily)